MLTDTAKKQIRIAFDNLATNIVGFNKRFTQNKMIAEIAKILFNEYQGKNILCVEAPTGTGKTFAYLIAGIISATELKIKLIISSSNVALQEQLLLKDIPDIKKYIDNDFTFVLAKGRSRYVCIRDLIRVIDDKKESANNVLFNKPITIDEINNLKILLEKLQLKRWDGEIDSLNNPLNKEIWQKISCNSWTCSANKCDFYRDCVFFKARKKINNADVIITNHDLVLADIVTGNKVLPDISQSFIIFDEAHHLANKALNHFAFNISLDNIKNYTNYIIITIDKIIKTTKYKYQKIYKKNNNIDDINNYLAELIYIDNIYLFKLGKLDEDFFLLCNNLYNSFKQLVNDFETVKSHWENSTIDDKIFKEQIDDELNICNMYINNVDSAIYNFIIVDDATCPPQSRWIEYDINNSKNYKLHSAKINIANDLDKILWKKVVAAILTSATLSSFGNFNRLNEQLNLNDINTKYLRLPTTFNLKNSDFIVAKMKYLPTDDNHSIEVAEQIINRIKKKTGVLVLFASNYQMQLVADLVNTKIVNLLVQGEFSKQNILIKHIENINKGRGSVIFGLDSFSEGVDLKGNYLTQLIIVKLRFSVPNSPIEKTVSDYLITKNKNSFIEIAMPDVCLRLAQACGRLVRSESDTGSIIILDKRIITKQYGKQLLTTVDDYNIIVED